MSYDIDLCDPVTGNVLELPEKHHMAGGTHCLGGTTEMSLNVTYNYAGIFKMVFGDEGIRSIYGRVAATTIQQLQMAADALRNDTDEDYWKPTEGNVKAALLQLLALAQMRPDGVWKGD